MSVETMFSSIAKRYDLCNNVMSMGLHKIWNKRLIEATLTSQPPKTYLDLCAGTGEIAFGYLKKCEGSFPPPHETYLLDFSSKMLSFAREKSVSLGISQNNIIYLKANAEVIPLEDHSVDAVTLAYGIRNVLNPRKCFEEVARVLKPTGKLGIVELTRPPRPWIAFAHTCYLKTWIPTVGRLFSPNAQAYNYLRQSIRSFVPPEQLKSWLELSGFKNIELTPLTGGIATLIVAEKS